MQIGNMSVSQSFYSLLSQKVDEEVDSTVMFVL